MENFYKKFDIESERLRIENFVNHYFLDETKNSLQDLKKIRSSFEEKEKIIFDILAEHLIMCERISPYSSKFFFDFLKNRRIKENYKSRVFSKHDLEKIIKIKEANLKNLLLDAIDLCSIHSKLTLDSNFSLKNLSYIEVTSGYFFENLHSVFSIKEKYLNKVKVFVIDGFIESVSEIHHFLELSSSQDDYFILFARGISDEVIHTIKVNYDRKTLRVIPVVVNFDLDGINLLNDIAVCCNTDVINTQKGNLISSISTDNAKTIDKIIFSKEGLLINNDSKFIDYHIKNLQQKLLDTDNEDIEFTLKKRIQRLGQNQVSIKIANDQEKFKNYFLIDNAIRSIKSCTAHGIADFSGDLYPLASVNTGIFYAKKYISLFDSVGGIIC